MSFVLLRFHIALIQKLVWSLVYYSDSEGGEINSFRLVTLKWTF